MIPKGHYGAGVVRIWDRGFYTPILRNDDKVEFLAKGERLSRRYVLVKMKKAEEKSWLLMKAGE